MTETKTVLELIEKKISIETDAFTPKDFFKGREGLYIGYNFQKEFLPNTKDVKKSAFSLQAFKLIESANDAKIEESLPKEYLFDESEVCSIIADLISKQPKGQEGILLNDWSANLFYTPSFVVRVSWFGGEWFVFAGHRDGNACFSISRVFSPATVS